MAKARQQFLVSQVENLRAELVLTKREARGGSIQAPSPGRLVGDAPKWACSAARTMRERLREWLTSRSSRLKDTQLKMIYAVSTTCSTSAGNDISDSSSVSPEGPRVGTPTMTEGRAGGP